MLGLLLVEWPFSRLQSAEFATAPGHRLSSVSRFKVRWSSWLWICIYLFNRHLFISLKHKINLFINNNCTHHFINILILFFDIPNPWSITSLLCLNLTQSVHPNCKFVNFPSKSNRIKWKSSVPLKITPISLDFAYVYHESVSMSVNRMVISVSPSLTPNCKLQIALHINSL